MSKQLNRQPLRFLGKRNLNQPATIKKAHAQEEIGLERLREAAQVLFIIAAPVQSGDGALGLYIVQVLMQSPRC